MGGKKKVWSLLRLLLLDLPLQIREIHTLDDNLLLNCWYISHFADIYTYPYPSLTKTWIILKQLFSYYDRRLCVLAFVVSVIRTCGQK